MVKPQNEEGEIVALGEADSCRRHIVLFLLRAGGNDQPHPISEQHSVADGRVIFLGGDAEA